MEFLTEGRIDLINGKEIIVKNFANWTSGNEVIDNFIQEKQLEYKEYSIVFEWIPYNEFIGIKEIDGNDGFATAIWKEGPLSYDSDVKEWIRTSYEEVILRFLYVSEDITNEFINKVIKIFTNLYIGIILIFFLHFDRLNHI
jgi:hypothetical protein